MRFALLTCDPLPEHDPDEAPLLDALRGRGHEADPMVWDNPAADFTACDAIVLRATWDYAHKADAFRAWLDRPDVAARLLNPPGAVRWNLDKRYLLELASRGIPIVPTAIVDRGDPAGVAACARSRGWDDIVVKPVVSAGSVNTARFTGDAIHDPGSGADLYVRTWRTDAPAMVQPYLRSVEGGSAGEAERAIVWIDGEVSHVIEKSRRFAGDAEAVSACPAVADADRDLADRVVAACGHAPLYARVDVMQVDSGETVLSELELIEPSMYFSLAPGSVDRFADSLERRVATMKS